MLERESARRALYLVARARGLCCALPLSHVLEIMRPLPIEAIAGTPSFVLGVAVVRGAPTPVIDCGAFVQGQAAAAHTRWASVRCGEHTAALAFEAIAGVRALPEGAGDLPPLVAGAPGELIERLATLDAQLMLVLHGSRLVPEPVWSALEAARAGGVT